MAKKKKQARGPAKQPRNTPPKQPTPPPSPLAVHRPFYERLLFVLALLGMLVTVHLNVMYGAEGAVVTDDPICGAGFDCSAVIASDPMPLGIPSAVWGLLFYIGVAGLCVGILYFADARRLLLKRIRFVMIGLGFLYSLFLTIYQFFVLSDRCLLCLISATTVTVMAVVLALYVFKPGKKPAGRKAASAASEYKIYGGLAVVFILLAGIDYGYFGNQASATAGTRAASGSALPVADDRPVDVTQCRFRPDLPHYSNINQIITDLDPVQGNPDALVTMIEFMDPNCPHCRTLHPTMKAVIAKYEDKIRFVTKPIALVGGPTHSRDEVAALWLAEEQGKFSEMLEFQMVEQTPNTGLSINRLTDHAEDLGMDPVAFKADLTEGRFHAQVRRAKQIFDGMRLPGVPAVILEGRVIDSGSRSVGCLSYFIDQELEAKGVVDEAETPAEETAPSTDAAATEG